MINNLGTKKTIPTSCYYADTVDIHAVKKPYFSFEKDIDFHESFS